MGYLTIRVSLDKLQVRVRLRSSQKRSDFKSDAVEQTSRLSAAYLHNEFNGGLSFTLRGQEGLQIEYEILTPSILSSSCHSLGIQS